MNIAIYDPDEQDVRRPWDEYLSKHECHFLETLNNIDSDISAVFCHGSYLNDDIVRSYRNNHEHLPMIVVSGGGPAAWWIDSGVGYWRKSTLGKEVFNQSFKDCVSSFLDNLAEGELDFSLLEPAAAPEALLSLYLCSVGDVDLKPEQKTKMIEKAEHEFQSLVASKEISEENAGSWVSIKEELDTGLVAKVGKFLKALELKG